MIRAFVVILAVVALAGCASRTPAPVIERTPAPDAAPTSKGAVPLPQGDGRAFHTVKRGETLYSIALEHGQDYKDVAAWNNLDNPNRLHVGQQLRIAPAEVEAPVAVVKPVTSAAPLEARPMDTKPVAANTDAIKREPRGGKLPWSEQALASLREPAPLPAKTVEKPAEKPSETLPAAVGDEAIEWTWPAPGKPLAGYSEGAGGNKGIDIAGQTGEPVAAAAAGKVVYVGGGLRGYGNLVIVRHNATYLSAYGHNSKILVKEGQSVIRGQKIAEIGSSDADQAKLHFEIRRQGKPIDPLKYLPAR